MDCSLADLAAKKDGEWVTVGGMIAECKRIRTKKGDPMMFATLDDLEGQVELLVFNSAYAANADKVDVDKIVIVRGRVDHKEAGETKLVAQEVEAFEPTEEEVAARGRGGGRRADRPAADAPRVARACRRASSRTSRRWSPTTRASTSCCSPSGERRLVLGPDFRVSANERLPSRAVGLHGAARVVA